MSRDTVSDTDPRRDLLACLLGLSALGALGLYASRDPLAITAVDPRALGLPDSAFVLRVARTLAAGVLLNLAALGCGTWCMRALPSASIPRAGAVVPLAMGFALLSIITLGLAAVHRLESWAIGSVVCAGAAVGVGSLWSALRRRRAEAVASRDRLSGGVIALCVTALAAPFLAAFGPDPGWDALTYHLAVPERYLFANAIVVSPYSVLSAFPHATAMLYLLAQSLEGPALARLLHLEFGVLVAVLAWRIARAESLRAGWLTAATLAACPLFAWELTVAYADLTATLYTLLAVAALYATSDDDMKGRTVIAGLFAGAAAACRYPSWPLIPVLALCLWLPASPSRGRLAQRAGATAIFLLASAVPLLPWLARNAIFTGNPTAPLLQALFASPGAEYFAPLALEQNAGLLRAIGFGRDPGSLLALPWNLTFAAELGNYRAFGFRIGVLYFVGLIAALARHAHPATRRARAPTGFSAAAAWWPAALLTVVWFVTAQEPRYLLPVLVLVAIGGGVAADRLLPAGLATWTWAIIPALAVLHTQLPIVTAVPHRYGLAAGTVAAEVAPAERVADHLRDVLEDGERVALFFEPRGFYFSGLDYLPYHLGDGSPLLVELHQAAQEERVAGWLASLGVTHVVLETRPAAIATPHFTSDYTPTDFASDTRALEHLLATKGTRQFAAGSLIAYRVDVQP